MCASLRPMEIAKHEHKGNVGLECLWEYCHLHVRQPSQVTNCIPVLGPRSC
jgi:hypothetical protein